MFIHIPSVVKPAHIFLARNRISKSSLMAQICFHFTSHVSLVHIPSVVKPWNFRRWASIYSHTRRKKIFKGRNASATALERFASDTADVVFIHILSVVKPVHIFMARNRFSKSSLMDELCFYCFADFHCIPIYIFCFHHKQWLAIRSTSVFWNSPLSCLVVLMSPQRTKRVCYCCEMVG